MAFPRVLLVTALALLVRVTAQQGKDPLKDFCRRFGHQTAVIDRKLYIDGGFVNYNPLDQNPENYTSTVPRPVPLPSDNRILYADFDVDNQGMPQAYANLSKPSKVPSVNGGILWPDTVNKLLYLYGGEFGDDANSPDNFTLWMYDAIYNTWNATSDDETQNGIKRASYGAGVAVQDRAVGYYYGGWLSNYSVPEWGDSPVALSHLLQYDMLKNTWTNSSGPDSVGRAEGVMLYVPASDTGMLVYFGGVTTPSENGTVRGQPMDEILLYDIANSKWYTQKATGQVPEQRRRFCAGVTWAEDRSSYNIYLYGGLGVPQGLGFDDIYILSIPSFRWIKWYPLSPGKGFPHHSMSCDVVDGTQMIVMGGSFTNSTSCDVAPIYGMHNMDLGKQNAVKQNWAKFNPNLTSYKVPSEIISVIGGSPTGGARVKTPSDGFDDRDLQPYFERSYTPATRSPTRPIPSATSPADSDGSSRPVGAIVGGVIGGVAGALIIAGLVWFLLRRQRKKKEADAATTTTSAPGTAVASPVQGAPVLGNGFSDPKPPPEHNLSESFAPRQIHGEGHNRHQRTASELDPAGLVELSSPEAEAVAASRAQYSATSTSPGSGGVSSPGSWWKPDGSGSDGLGLGNGVQR
ncbi:hypothetical protein P170DRAFT_422622 [Aspergillus steynii IBT 23096]|uniref:Kelch repeat protein n=1 Tax=Aspergillus steynii IBT 23096 TaxID=1392250 RepID=A0A2I2GFH7_9EURO|nr:uncharacterized protein P170DRAFT_422622 [Aspergillus steynii IBT 23096]PLB51632.1 hypothetical protein P170DRAFT_422622 [Aspergillus steynii IBT 23096]